MVVDDEPEMGELVGAWLERAGFKVTHCSYGWDGTTTIRMHKPDLVVSDIVMTGGLDGWDMAYLLEVTGSAVPVILMTGFSRKVIEKNRALPDNDIGYLEKPFRESDLRALIPAALLQRAGATPTS